MRFLPSLLLATVFLSGCQSPVTPDPNDPAMQGPRQAVVLKNNLQWASDAANLRVYKGEINADQAKQLVDSYAQRLTKFVNPKNVPADQAYFYGNLFLTAGDWTKARDLLEVAVAHAPNQDRRVNDSLRLALALTELDDVPKAVEIAKSTFNAGPTEKAPILPAVLLTIVPAAAGKGHQIELADLLKGAIYQDEANVVNPKLPAGKLFLLARPPLVRQAWHEVIQLYIDGGKGDLAQKAGREAQANVASLVESAQDKQPNS